jgi:hypothetical protein
MKLIMILQSQISKYTLNKTIISLLILVLIPGVTRAQKKVIETQADTISFFRGIEVSADAVGALQLSLGSYGQYEIHLRANFRDKYFPVVELGYGKADADDASTFLRYKTNAPYGRMGIDFNLLKNKHDIYRLYGGVRYAYTSFKYDVIGRDTFDPIWHTEAPYQATNEKANYHWLEFVLGIDAKIWGPLHLGWSIRYRRRLLHKDGEVGAPWYIPGFGREGTSRLGGTFDVIVEI